MSIDSLKDQARRHERDEEWQKALDLYLKAIDRLDGVDEPDVSIFNRAADLHVRLGNQVAALDLYDRAIDLYLDSDLPNNAIAICRKMIRHVPDRVETFRRMGQIRAVQGFAVDARQNYLTYAEVLHARGEGEEALAALEELVQRVPSDWETRILLAEGFLKQERTEEALRQLRAAWEHLAREGADSERADALKERILELDPDAELDVPQEDPDWGSWTDTDPRGGGVPGFEATGLESLAGFGDDTPPAGGLEPRVEEPASPAFGPDLADPQGESEDDLPTPLPVEEEGGDEAEAVVSDFEFQEILGEAAPEPDAGLETAEPEAPEDGLPFMEGSEPLPEEASPGELEFQSLTDEEPEVLQESDEHRVPDDLPESEELEQPGEWEDAEELEDLPFLHMEPDPQRETDPEEGGLAALRGEVEEAFRTEDRERLMGALAALGSALAEAGNPEAETVYGQLLQLDPGNVGALSALGRAGPLDGPLAEAPPEEDLQRGEEAELPEESAAEEAPSGGAGYVDLGSMIFDDSLGEKTTRWTVAAEEPSGDEGADFARMLAQFKDKVAQNLEGEDARSQYDLGTAYKEMGLLDEAISMFQKALRMEPGHLAAIEMLGQCFLDQDQPLVAIRVLTRGVARGSEAEDDLVGIYYFLGQAHESAGNPDEAREFYEKVFALDINFRDVTERLRALR